MTGAWPIEEVWARPLATWLLSALVPFATARVLRALTLPPVLPADEGEAARALAPFRAAAFLVGVVQIQIAWALGVTALGPALLPAPDAPASWAFGALCAATSFAVGGPARAIEPPPAKLDVAAGRRPKPLALVVLRLRMLPWLTGPLLAAAAASTLPMVSREGEVRWGVAALAALATCLGVAYGGPLLSVATLALRPASPALRALARRVAAREGIPWIFTLRLPTHGVPFANAAALPWARTMIVTDYIAELLAPEELEAVLAHEAGHLSEAPWVSACRLGAVATLLFATTSGARIADALSPGASAWVTWIGLLAAVPMVLLVLALARKMEERADAHARANVSADALADALAALARDARMPLVTGRRHARMHPDLYDRICACGRDLGPRPAPPNRRAGLIAGLVVSAGLVALPFAGDAATAIEPGTEVDLGASAAIWRLRVDPWDAHAMLALAWASASAHDPSRAAARVAEARRLGARASDVMELEAELLAQNHECDQARDRFDAAIRARAEESFAAGIFEPLELGGYHLPRTLVSECGYGD
ncbi:MAG: M48 family metalloprotease [Sandaracinus sp.]